MLSINDSGIFTASKPFVIPNELYTIKSILTIQSMLDLGLDPYKLIYAPVGVSEQEYKSYSKDTSIYLLKGSGKTLYVPVEHILDLDDDTYIPYATKALVINLGPHPANRTFLTLLSKVSGLISEVEGISISAAIKDVSKPQRVDHDTHTTIQATRQDRKVQEVITNIDQIKDNEIAHLQARINALQDFILNYAETCKGQVCCGRDDFTLPDDVVYYQYSLADYYVQASLHRHNDLPINNLFINDLKLLSNKVDTYT